MKENYVSHVLLDYILDGNFDAQFNGRWVEQEEYLEIIQSIPAKAFAPYGFDARGHYADDVAKIIQYLRKNGGINKRGDDYIGNHFQLVIHAKDAIIRRLISDNPIQQNVEALGDEVISRALRKIAEEDGLRPLDAQTDELTTDSSERNSLEFEIPASDRIVTLSHNQVSELGASIDELVKRLEVDNGDPEAPGLRERLLGQIKAGRELIFAGQFRAYLIYEVLVRALNEIIAKYGNETIKSLANALLGAVVSQILEG